VPVQVSGLTSGVTAISGGYGFTCAVVNSAALCWGLGDHGQLGNNSIGQSLLPIQVTGLSGGVEFIEAGYYYACAIVNGGAQCWGLNANGQLGNNSTAQCLVPVDVTGYASLLGGFSYTPSVGTASVGILFNLPATLSGGIPTSCTASPSLPAGLSISPNFCVISGTASTEVPSTNYTITASNSTGTISTSVYLTTKITPPSALNYSSPITYQVGASINLVPTVTGLVSTYAVTPALPSGINLNTITGVISGTSATVVGASTYAITASNTSGSATFYMSLSITSNTGATAIAAGQNHSCAIVNGGVKCWGYNYYGQLGTGSFTSSSLVPAAVNGLTSGVTAIATGSNHSCAIVNGGVQCWGWNGLGQLGNNSSVDSSIPVQVSGLTSGVTAIAAGYYHTCAIVNGVAKCWGANIYGNLGNGSSSSSLVPVQVSGLTSGVTAIASGQYHTCAIVNGGLQCWGINTTVSLAAILRTRALYLFRLLVLPAA
jgi:alpha-tubulin suppressor-like RCC1 family protein